MTANNFLPGYLLFGLDHDDASEPNAVVSTPEALAMPPDDLFESALRSQEVTGSPAFRSEPLSAPGATTTFDAIGLQYQLDTYGAGSGSFPPDPHGAAGPDHVVNVVNRDIQWFTKSGVLESTLRLGGADFFDAGAASLFEPKVLYDQHADRFVVVANQQANLNNGNTADDVSRIYVAVSDDSNPNGTWFKFSFDSLVSIGGANHWADYPGLAVDEQAIYITQNYFSTEGNAFGGSRLWIIPKADFYATGAAPTPILTNPNTPRPDIGLDNDLSTWQPAHVMGDINGATTGTYLVAYSGLHWISGPETGQEIVSVTRIDDPLGAGRTFTNNLITVGNISDNSIPDAPQLSGAAPIETNDERALGAVWFNNHLYVTTTVDPGNGQATAHWFDFNANGVSAATLAQQGNIDGEDIAPGTHTFFPAVSVNSAGTLGFGFSASGPGIHAGSYFTMRLASDPTGTVQNSQVLHAGEDSYELISNGRNRWGDYSAISLDPTDDTTFWVYNEHAASTPDTGSWGTAWGQFDPVNDAAPVLSTAATPTAGAIEDAGFPVGAVGSLVSSLVDFPGGGGNDNVSDVDAGAVTGIAVVGAATGSGAWFYSINDGADWSSLDAVSTSSARLLAANAFTRLYFRPNADIEGTIADALTFRAWDQSSTTNGALADTTTNGGTSAFSSATDGVNVSVAGVNDAPVNSLQNRFPSVNEDTDLVFNTANANRISISDIDANPAAQPFRVTLSVTQGMLTLGSTSGITFETGDGVQDSTMVFTGTPNDINAALNGLVFRGAPNANGSVQLTIVTNDQGATGADPGLTGDGSSEQDSDTAFINVRPVNDPPDGTDNTVTTLEDGAYTFTKSDFGFTDPDGNNTFAALKITTLPTAGTLTRNDAPVNAGDFIPVPDIDDGLLEFVPAANGNGTPYATFTFQVKENDVPGTSSSFAILGEVDPTPNTMTVDVTPVPDLFVWSALADGQVIAFDPASQVLQFDGGIPAAAVSVGAVAGSTIFSHGGKTVTLQVDIASITTGNVIFDDASVLVVGDNTVDTAADDAANTLLGGSGNDSLMGLQGNDYLQSRGGADALEGGDGNDQLEGGAGADVLAGDAGFDYAKYAYAAAAVEVDLGLVYANTGEAAGDTFQSIEGVIGSRFGDKLYGDTGVNDLAGLAGDDELQGGDGNDNLQGGDGNDALFGGAGGDRLVGGAGTDFARYDFAAGAVLVNLTSAYQNSGEAAGDGYLSLEGVVGSAFGDTLVGDGNVNDLRGGDGNDTMQGRAGADVLSGGEGNDQLEGGLGGDTLDGGAGFDWARYVYAGSGVDADLAATEPSSGEAIGDTYVLIEGLIGSQHADVLYGDANGNDLAGLGGTDALFGRDGGDNLQGGAADDVLDGGAGADRLVGDGGNDTFVFRLGEADGDEVVDFDGQGGADGDTLRFENYGPGATFTNIDATHWRISTVGGLVQEIVTFRNGASIDASDFTFV